MTSAGAPRIGHAEIEAGRYEDAAAAIEAHLAAHPTDRLALLDLGLLWLTTLHKGYESLFLFDRMLALDENDPEALFWSAFNYYLMWGEPEHFAIVQPRLTRLLESAAPSAQRFRSHAHRILGEILGLGSATRLEHLRAAVRDGPGYPSNHLALASDLQRRGDLREALAALKEARRLARHPIEAASDFREAYVESVVECSVMSEVASGTLHAAIDRIEGRLEEMHRELSRIVAPCPPTAKEEPPCSPTG